MDLFTTSHARRKDVVQTVIPFKGSYLSQRVGITEKLDDSFYRQWFLLFTDRWSSFYFLLFFLQYSKKHIESLLYILNITASSGYLSYTRCHSLNIW